MLPARDEAGDGIVDIGRMTEIMAGADIEEEAAFDHTEEAEDMFIAGTIEEFGAGNGDGEPLGSKRSGDAFAFGFTIFVEVAGSHGGGFRGDGGIGARGKGAHDTGTTDMENTGWGGAVGSVVLDSGEEVVAGEDVGLVVVVGGATMLAEEASGMDDTIGVGEEAGEGIWFGEGADMPLDGEVRESGAVGGGAGEGMNCMALIDESPGKGTTNETGGTGDEELHYINNLWLVSGDLAGR